VVIVIVAVGPEIPLDQRLGLEFRAVQHDAQDLLFFYQLERLLDGFARRFARLHDEDDPVHHLAQKARFRRRQERRGIQDDVAVIVPGCHVLNEGFHAVRPDQFHGVLLRVASGQDGQLVDRGLDQEVRYVLLPQEVVGQAPLGLQAEKP